MRIADAVVLFAFFALTSACPMSSLVPTPEPIVQPLSCVVEGPLEATDLYLVSGTRFGHYVVGFVENTSDSTVRVFRLRLNSYDSSGVLLDEEIDNLSLHLYPGERYPIGMYLSSGAWESFDRCLLSFDPSESYMAELRLWPELEVVSESWGDEKLTAVTVRNSSQRTAEWVSVRAAGYDSQGRLVAVGKQILGVTTMLPGASAICEIDFWSGDPTKVASYQFFISAELEE